MPKFKIVSHGHGDDTQVFMDGKEIECLTDVDFSVEAGKTARVVLVSYLPEMDIEADVDEPIIVLCGQKFKLTPI